MININLLNAESHFAFGKNWLDYSRKIDETKIAQAMADLRRLSGRERFDNLSFLDIGCGSGLHSLAAIRLGATRVVGVDIDIDSVTASRNTLAKFAPGADARFNIVSVFDMCPETHGGFDLVYSWGVLHHTGDMYGALAAAANLVKEGGTLMIALYRKTPFCGMWRIIKRWYTKASPRGQRYAMGMHISLQRIASKIKGNDFDNYIQNYGTYRGMDFYNDLHDWIGGYPYESISPEECHVLFKKLDFKLVREFLMTPGRYLPGLLGTGCDEYTFVRGDRA